MGRPQGSRNRSLVVPERLEKDATTDVDMKTVAPQVAEKFNNFPPAQDIEKDKKILRRLEGIEDDDDELDEEDEDAVKKAVSELPFYLRNMPEGSDKSKHIIAAAQAAIILGTPVAQVAMQYGIPHNRVSAWRDTLITTGAIGRRDRLSAMLMSYIEQEMKSLMAISIVTSDEDWVMRQTASDLAHYVSVKSDRLLMLLQAFGRVENSQREYEQQLKALVNNA